MQSARRWSDFSKAWPGSEGGRKGPPELALLDRFLGSVLDEVLRVRTSTLRTVVEEKLRVGRRQAVVDRPVLRLPRFGKAGIQRKPAVIVIPEFGIGRENCSVDPGPALTRLRRTSDL